MQAGSRQPYRSATRDAAAEATRGRIVAAARQLLMGGENLPAFSIDGVARQAGVTRLTIYNQFTSKCGLLEAVFDDLGHEGGICELPALLELTDTDRALRGVVSVYCGFWAHHGRVMPRLAALAKLDDEIALNIRCRVERRREVLATLVDRLHLKPAPRGDLVDVLFALTGFDLFESLHISGRSAAGVEQLVQQLVAQAWQTAAPKP